MTATHSLFFFSLAVTVISSGIVVITKSELCFLVNIHNIISTDLYESYNSCNILRLSFRDFVL